MSRKCLEHSIARFLTQSSVLTLHSSLLKCGMTSFANNRIARSVFLMIRAGIMHPADEIVHAEFALVRSISRIQWSGLPIMNRSR